VVPFYHLGMAGVLPQHNTWVGNMSNPENYHNLVINWLRPGTGQHVKVWFGERLHFDDLIAEHEARHGPLHKVSAAPVADSWDQELARWKTGDAEKELYHLITLRIQDALLELEMRAKQDVAANPSDKMVVACPRCLASTPPGKIIDLRSGDRKRAPPYAPPPMRLVNASAPSPPILAGG